MEVLSYGPNVSEGREFNLMSEMVGKLLVVLLGEGKDSVGHQREVYVGIGSVLDAAVEAWRWLIQQLQRRLEAISCEICGHWTEGEESNRHSTWVQGTREQNLSVFPQYGQGGLGSTAQEEM